MHEAALLDEIYAAPDDDGPRSIYADYLIEHGDPRGTFIALQLARVRDRVPAPSAEEQQLLDTHWRRWVGTAAGRPAFERGFWSSLVVSDHVPTLDLAHPAWGTVQRLELDNDPQLAVLLAASGRSLRSIVVPSREAFGRVARSGLAIEELVLGFDMSRDPPPLGPVTALPSLRRLGFHCLAELAVRWLERADDIGIRDVHLDLRPHVDYLREVMARAKRTRLARLAISLRHELVLVAERDADGSFAIRTIHIEPREGLAPTVQLDWAKQWLGDLRAHVDPGVKVTMPAITPALAAYADAHGMRLVAHATQFAARPRG